MKDRIIKEIKRVTIFTLFFLFANFSFAQNKQLPPDIESKLQGFSDSEKVNYLGKLCWDLREKSNKEAIQYGRYAFDLADSLQFYNKAAEISNYLGVAFLYYSYNTEEAWENFRKALSYGIKSNDSVQIAYAYDNLAYMHLIYGDLNEAFEYDEKALNIFASLNIQQGLAYVYNNLGLIHQANKNFDTAFEYFKKAYEIHKNNNNEIGLAATLSCTGETFLLNNQPDSAMLYFSRQLELSEKTGHEKYIALALKGKGKVYFEQEEYDKALKMVDQAMKLNAEKKDDFGLLQMHIDKALILSKINRAKEGEEELNKALVLASKMRLPKTISDIYKAYTNFYKNSGYYKNAALNFTRVFELYDSVYKEHQTQTIINENQKFEIKQNLQEAKDEIAIEKIKAKFYYAIIFIFVLLVSVHYWRYRIYKRFGRELKQKNIEIQIENDKKNQALKELKKSQQYLKESNTTKDKLFSIIAHDLRSPFSAILGFSQILYDNDATIDNQQKKEMAKMIYTTSHRTFSLLDNLLIWSRSQTNGIKYQPKKIGLKLIIEENVLIQQNGAEKKNIIFDTDVKEHINVFADTEMLNTIFRNLLSNAIKFTPEKGKISVSAIQNKDKKEVEITVSDTGCGISEEILKRIFEIYKPKIVRTAHAESGTGLGLPLCKEFIEKQGGTITIKSQPDKGTTFIVTLPSEGSV